MTQNEITEALKTVEITELAKAKQALIEARDIISAQQAELKALREQQQTYYIIERENKKFRNLLIQAKLDLTATRKYMREMHEKAHQYQRAFNNLHNSLNWYGRQAAKLANLMFWKKDLAHA